MDIRQLLPNESLESLASLVATVDQAEVTPIEWRDHVTIYFLRNFTIEPIEPYLKFHLLREHIRPQISYGGYGTISQEIIEPTSILHSDEPDIIVLSLMLEILDSSYNKYGWQADNVLRQLEDMFDLLLGNTKAITIINTFIPSFYALEGIIEATKENSIEGQVNKLNNYLRNLVTQHPHKFVLLDWERFMRIVGKDEALDLRFWRLSQAPFKKNFLNLYAREITKTIRALKGRAKKCLVLDCDNTLWGGVLGEDGIDGIALHPNEWPGAAYFEFQRVLLGLQERGVLLALCSKNNEGDVWDILDKHPHNLLRKSHLVSWRINWDNKAENIAAMADELNIGLDSMVFVEDSPRECALVKEMLPDVTVIQVPNELYDYPNLLLTDGLFDTLAVSDEDKNRLKMYQQEKLRKKKRRNFADITEYLESLRTSIRIATARESELQRVAQLTQKTNQFNLTTRRYSESEIRDQINLDDTSVYIMAVADRYGDMGLSGVLIAKRNGKIGIVDSLLLSCRVLGRQLEFAFVDQCMRILEEIWHIKCWQTEYKPTKKNKQVADFWDRFGFTMQKEVNGNKVYTMKVGPRSCDYLKIMSVHLE